MFPYLVSISGLCQPTPSFQTSPGLLPVNPCSAQLRISPSPKPFSCLYSKQVSEAFLTVDQPGAGWEAGAEALGSASLFQRLPTSTFLMPGSAASSLLPDRPRELGPQHPVLSLLKDPQSWGYQRQDGSYSPCSWPLKVSGPQLSRGAAHSFIHSILYVLQMESQLPLTYLPGSRAHYP